MVKMKNVCWLVVLMVVVSGGWVAAEGSDPILGMVSYWPFDEGSGDMAYDSYGDNHGSLKDPCWATGQIDGALEFNGVDDNIDLGTDSSLKMDLPVTCCAWIKLSSTGSSDMIIALGKGQSNWYYGVFVNIRADGLLLAHIGDGTGKSATDQRWKEGTTVLTDGQWYHVAAVVRGGVDMELYINGENDGGSYGGTGGSLKYAGTNGSSFIGGTTSESIGTTSPFDGVIDDVAVFNRALTPEEIEQIYQDGLAGLGLELDYRQIAINKIEGAIAAKTEAIELVDLAIERERAAFRALDELRESGEFGELGVMDVFKARLDILWAMGRQIHAKFNLSRSIRKLEKALNRLTMEPDHEPPPPPEGSARPRLLRLR